jgi:PEP-CTERM motif
MPKLGSIGTTGQALAMGGGMEFDGLNCPPEFQTCGSFTYTSGANDASTGVVLEWQASRTFSATAGGYFLKSVLQGSREQPAFGLVTNISLSTTVASRGAGTPSEANAIVGLLLGTNDFSSIVSGAAYNYNSTTSDQLIMTGEIDIHPTAQGQVFTFNFPNAVGSLIQPIPEPSTFLLLAIGIGGMAGIWALKIKKKRVTEFSAVRPIHVAAYIEELQTIRSKPTVKAAPGRHRAHQIYLFHEHEEQPHEKS